MLRTKPDHRPATIIPGAERIGDPNRSELAGITLGEQALTNYTPDYFAGLQENALSSAREIVPLIIELCAPRSVIDVGCGNGCWLSVFREHGVEDVQGVDGTYLRPETLLIPVDRFRAHDLSTPLRLEREFDLALSLEVAEHIPAGSAALFVESLTTLAPIVVFSAAIPSQGGTDHVNERWPDYWAGHFSRHGFEALDCLRRRIWDNDRVLNCYAQNTIVYARAGVLPEIPRASAGSLPIVHPRIFSHKLERAGQPRQLLSALPGSILQSLRTRVRRS